MTKKTAVVKKVSAKDLQKAVFGDPKELVKLSKTTLKVKGELKKIELKIKTIKKITKQKESLLKKATVVASKKKTVASANAKKTLKLAVDKMKKELKLTEKMLVEVSKKWKLALNQEELCAKREVSRQWAVLSFVKKWEKEFAAKSKPKKKLSTKSANLKTVSVKQVKAKSKPVNTVIPMVSQTQARDVSEFQSHANPVSAWDDNLKRN